MSLIAFTSLAPTNDHCGEPAGLLGAAGQRSITGGQENQMAEIGALEADRAGVRLAEKVAGIAAAGTGPDFEYRDDHEFTWPRRWCLRRVLFG